MFLVGSKMSSMLVIQKRKAIKTINPTIPLRKNDHIIAWGTAREAVFTSSARWAAESDTGFVRMSQPQRRDNLQMRK